MFISFFFSYSKKIVKILAYAHLIKAETIRKTLWSLEKLIENKKRTKTSKSYKVMNKIMEIIGIIKREREIKTNNYY